MNKKIGIFILSVLCLGNVYSQKRLTHIGVAFNNYVTAKPISGFSKLFTTQIHPGITVSTGFNWKEKEKYQLMQTFKVGVFHHRFIQTGVPLYSEFMYRYKPSSKIGLSAGLGAGYLHMFPGDEHFRQNESGGWDVIKMKSRPQGMISLSLGIDYQITSAGNKAFIRYQNVLQTPFVPGYVPLLPYNVFHIGTTFPLVKK